MRVVQRKEAVAEINEDVYQLKVAVETLKRYHRNDEDDEKGDDEKDAHGKPHNDKG